jgi:uncharacterized membrane protein
MGGMMSGGGMGAWLILWIVLALTVAAAGGVMIARALSIRSEHEPSAISPADSSAVRKAKDTLKLRYAHGEISREEYLQGKVELED